MILIEHPSPCACPELNKHHSGHAFHPGFMIPDQHVYLSESSAIQKWAEFFRMIHSVIPAHLPTLGALFIITGMSHE